MSVEKKKAPSRIPYFFSACRDLPGKFLLCYQPRSKPITEYVSVSPGGYRYRGQVHPSLPSLLQYYKEHYRERPPAPRNVAPYQRGGGSAFGVEQGGRSEGPTAFASAYQGVGQDRGRVSCRGVVFVGNFGRLFSIEVVGVVPMLMLLLLVRAGEEMSRLDCGEAAAAAMTGDGEERTIKRTCPGVPTVNQSVLTAAAAEVLLRKHVAAAAAAAAGVIKTRRHAVKERGIEEKGAGMDSVKVEVIERVREAEEAAGEGEVEVVGVEAREADGVAAAAAADEIGRVEAEMIAIVGQISVLRAGMLVEVAKVRRLEPVIAAGVKVAGAVPVGEKLSLLLLLRIQAGRRLVPPLRVLIGVLLLLLLLLPMLRIQLGGLLGVKEAAAGEIRKLAIRAILPGRVGTI